VWIAGLGGCDGCSGSNSGSDNVAATSGSGQITQVLTTFGAVLEVTVTTSGGTPVSGAVVTFTAPSQTVASATFAGGANTATTNASGVAMSAVVSANGIAGGPYTVAATVPNGAGAASFTLTNTPGPAAGISCTSGTPQTATINTTFTNPLGAQVVDGENNPVSDAGVVVTFTAPDQTLASATFAGGVNTATTNASGLATSQPVSANGIAGGPYNVTASATIGGATPTCNFSLTNTTTAVTTSQFSYYLSGVEFNDPQGDEFDTYSVAGSVTINTATGAVITGVQDYNDGDFITSPEPGGDRITGGQLTVNSSGQGTLTLNIPSDTNVGVEGVETLGIQMVNANHALIIQFDNSATSSGSMDLQTLPSTLSGVFSFAVTGVDNNEDEFLPLALGGIFTVTGTSITNGFFDVNDAGDVTLAIPLTANIGAADSNGRGIISSTVDGFPTTVPYYIIGPEAMRVIDVDEFDTAVGSAFGQGTSTNGFTNANRVQSVLTVASNPDAFPVFDVIGTFTPVTEAGVVKSQGVPVMNNFTGFLDIDEEGEVPEVQPVATSGTYFIDSDGYGGITFTGETTLDLNFLGMYAVDNAININDPNNTTTGLGGALIVDLDSVLIGTGVMVPQTDTSTTSFSGNYAFGAQNFNDVADEFAEVDFVGLASVNALAFNGTGPLNDPFESFSATPQGTYSFSGTATPDTVDVGAGRYTMTPLAIGTNPAFDATVAMYQAYGGLLFWMEEDSESLFLGPIESSTFTFTPGVAPVVPPAVKAKP